MQDKKTEEESPVSIQNWFLVVSAWTQLCLWSLHVVQPLLGFH